MGYRDILANYKNVLLGVLAALLIGIGLIWYSGIGARAYAMDNNLEASYQAAFFDLVDSTENLDVLLGKALVSDSKGQNIITLTTAWHEAERARMSLGQLPLEMPAMMRSQYYMAQLGDFCYSLAQKLAEDMEISQEEMKTLETLHNETRTIHRELRELTTTVAEEKQFRFANLARRTGKLTPEAKLFVDGFGKMDQRLQDEVPTLTYDGPFSDHVVNMEPRGLTGDEVSPQEASKIALDFVNELGYDLNVERSEESTGHIPTYNVRLRPQGQRQGETVVGVSQQGGHVVWMMYGEAPQANEQITREAAFKKAQEFIDQRDLGEFTQIGFLEEGNELLVNYAMVQDGIIIYPDMLQVAISLESGNIVGYDAAKFYTSHTERELPEPEITEDEAREKVNHDLEVENVRLALIPLANLDEKLCYEIKGTMNEDIYYVYVNAQTGKEEKVLLIVETEEGTRSI